jgi:hypothetical protein
VERLSAWIYRRFGQRAVYVYLGFEVVTAFLLTLGAIGLLSLYQHMTEGQFWLIVGFSYVCVLAASAAAGSRLRRQVEPLFEWMRGARGPDGAEPAWHAAVMSPRRLITGSIWAHMAFIAIPAPTFIVLVLHLPAYSFLILLAGSLVTWIYAAILHFFYLEIALRPVVRDIAAHLPPDFSGAEVGVPLRWKLLGSVPLINVITGVAVSGFSRGGSHSLSDLGISVVAAVAVAFTLSLELTILMTKSVMMPLRDLLCGDPAREGGRPLGAGARRDRRRDGHAGAQLQRHGERARGARAVARGVRQLRGSRRGRPRNGGGHEPRRRGGRGHRPLHRHL